MLLIFSSKFPTPWCPLHPYNHSFWLFKLLLCDAGLSSLSGFPWLQDCYGISWELALKQDVMWTFESFESFESPKFAFAIVTWVEIAGRSHNFSFLSAFFVFLGCAFSVFSLQILMTCLTLRSQQFTSILSGLDLQCQTGNEKAQVGTSVIGNE